MWKTTSKEFFHAFIGETYNCHASPGFNVAKVILFSNNGLIRSQYPEAISTQPCPSIIETQIAQEKSHTLYPLLPSSLLLHSNYAACLIRLKPGNVKLLRSRVVDIVVEGVRLVVEVDRDVGARDGVEALDPVDGDVEASVGADGGRGLGEGPGHGAVVAGAQALVHEGQPGGAREAGVGRGAAVDGSLKARRGHVKVVAGWVDVSVRNAEMIKERTYCRG